MPTTYDVIVIGAGIMGCSTAFQLARRGLKVALIEQGVIGDGPSGQSSAVIRQHYSNELTARMALYSLRVFQHFEDRVGGESGFKRTGFVLAVAAKDVGGLKANLEMQRRLGIETDLLSPDDMREIMPGIETSDLVSIAYEPEADTPILT